MTGVGLRAAIVAGATVCTLLVAVAATAQPGRPGEIVERAAAAFRAGTTVHVDQATFGAVGAEALDGARADIDEAGGRVYVAVLPPEVTSEVRGPRNLPRLLWEATSLPGTYIVYVDDRSIYIGSPDVSRERTDDMAFRARVVLLEEGPDAALRVAVRSAIKGEPVGTGGPPVGWVVAVAAFLAAALLVLLAAGGRALRRRRRGFGEVKAVAGEDVTRLGEDIAALDLDVHDPGVDDAARRDYGAALDAYEQAKTSLDKARRPEDLSAVTDSLEAGRYALTRVRARLAR